MPPYCPALPAGRCVVLLTAAVTAVLATSAGFVTFALRGEYAGQCHHCGRRFVVGTALGRCVSGHKIHQTCVGYAIERKACPNCDP